MTSRLVEAGRVTGEPLGRAGRQGKHPQTGLDVQEWGCSIAWLPLLLVENSAKMTGVQAATESFRNEMVKGQNVMNNILAANPQTRKEMKNISIW